MKTRKKKRKKVCGKLDNRNPLPYLVASFSNDNQQNNKAMNNAELKTTLAELMNQYNTARRAWLAAHGNDKGFHAWFTKQVTGEG